MQIRSGPPSIGHLHTYYHLALDLMFPNPESTQEGKSREFTCISRESRVYPVNSRVYPVNSHDFFLGKADFPMTGHITMMRRLGKNDIHLNMREEV